VKLRIKFLILKHIEMEEFKLILSQENK